MQVGKRIGKTLPTYQWGIEKKKINERGCNVENKLY